MEDRILINPENRMLGNSGSNDFSLYGAPADPVLTIRPADPETETDGSAPGDAPRSPSADAPDSLATPVGGATSATTLLPEGQSLGMAAAPTLAAPVAGEAAASDGSLGPAPAPALTVMALEGTALAPPVLTATPSSNAPASEGAETTAVLSGAPAATVPAFEGVEAVPLAASIVQDAQPELLAQAPLLGDVLTDGPQTGLAGLTAEVAPADALAPALDGVEDLLGADPAGGIATLVSLVSVSDVFDVSEAGSDIVQVADPVDLLDTLAADDSGAVAPADEDDSEPAETLLGPATDPLDDITDPLGGI
ncbi:MAG TPA: hypothetical protein VF574_07100 [Allosphingosinicella sp.]|jgi:hypothetical protein